MMTQSDLLERAKQGDPEAIAALMNLVLEPRGVTAQANLQESCLHVAFTSEQLLSSATLISFVRTGLKTIGSKTVQTVRLSACRAGQTTPIWSEVFAINNNEEPQPLAPAPEPKPASQLPKREVAPLRAIAALYPPPASQSPGAVGTGTVAPGMGYPGGVPQGVGFTTPNQAPMPVSSPAIAHGTFPTAGVGQLKPKRPKSLKKRPKQPQRSTVLTGKKPGKGVRRRPQVARRYVVASIVGAGAFLVGGVVAIMANLPAKSNSQAVSQAPGNNPSALTAAPSSQMLVPPNAQAKEATEQQTRQYLARMNKAQQAFYETNHRFADSLEELERSASIISQSAHYTYRLVLRDQSQSVLTATPKEEGLKSLSAAVFLAETAQGASSVTGLLCETTRPSTYPPVLPQEAGEVIQCPTDAVPVPY